MSSNQKDEKSLTKYNPFEDIQLSEEEKSLLLTETGVNSAIEMIPYVGGLIGLTNKFSEALDKKKLEKLLIILREKMDSQEQFLLQSISLSLVCMVFHYSKKQSKYYKKTFSVLINSAVIVKTMAFACLEKNLKCYTKAEKYCPNDLAGMNSVLLLEE